jgi:hypothetical protein
MTDIDDRIAHLEAEIAELKAQHTPSAPVPERPAKPPSWAQQSTNVGMAYCGPPSVTPTGDGAVWVREKRSDGSWRDPFGQWRYASGELIPKTVEPHPAGPERTPAHAEAVQLLDRIVETTVIKE